MNFNPFIAPFEQLPYTLPIFPLSGAIVMTGSELPLNIFEPRYLNRVLSGVCRCDLGEELPTTRGYCLIVPNWSRFTDDYTDYESILRGEHDLLIRKLKSYFEVKGLDVDWPMLERL